MKLRIKYDLDLTMLIDTLVDDGEFNRADVERVVQSDEFAAKLQTLLDENDALSCDIESSLRNLLED